MEVEFIEQALKELDDAVDYYNCQVPVLGQIFFDEVLQIIDLITKFPEAWPANTSHTRKSSLKKFPYSLIYSIEKNVIYILAVAHHHREPEYWIERIS